MTESFDAFDQRLEQLFESVELSPEFDIRLMARVQAESQYQATLAAVARQRQRLLGFLTLEVIAAGAVLVMSEAMLLHLLQSLPPRVTGSALWQMVSGGGLLSGLLLAPIAGIAAIVFYGLDYGRSPE
jgi:hypothetical protein